MERHAYLINLVRILKIESEKEIRFVPYATLQNESSIFKNKTPQRKKQCHQNLPFAILLSMWGRGWGSGK